MLPGLIIAIGAVTAAALLMRGDRRRLTGWTRTGNRDSRGQETGYQASGSPDWSRPRCEPDNGPRARAARVAPFAVMVAAGPGASWCFVHAVAWITDTAATWTEPWDQPDWQIRLQAATVAALVVAVGLWWMAWRSGVIKALREHHATRPRPAAAEAQTSPPPATWHPRPPASPPASPPIAVAAAQDHPGPAVTPERKSA